MKETWQLRVWHANVAPSDCLARGRRMGLVTRLLLDRDDPCLQELLSLHAARKAAGQTGLISYSDIERRYDSAELAAASLFQLRWTKMIEPSGEECGSVHDTDMACPVCSAGRTLRGQLRLSATSLPTTSDVAFTIARDERIVSERVADIIQAERFTGVELREIETTRTARGGPRWFHWVVTGPLLIFGTRARFANSPIDGRNEYACPMGDTLGHMLVSEAYVQPPAQPATDVMESLQYQGSASGLIVPTRTVFVSARFRAQMMREKVRGWEYEIAHYEDGAARA